MSRILVTMDANDYSGPIEADGRDYIVHIPADSNIRSYELAGDGDGSITVDGPGPGSALRLGSGRGCATRSGDGDGHAIRLGQGAGRAVS